MDVIRTSLPGLVRLSLDRARDERGSFARTFDAAAFAERGLHCDWPQHGEAANLRAGTLRGLHFQRAPHGEIKLIRCSHGAVHDVVVDVRPNSPTFGRWEAFTLTPDDGAALYVPDGFAHGYQTLIDGATMAYLISTPYVASAATGYRYDSPALAIPWPLEPTIVSERDRALPAFDPSRPNS